jgi:hypothetical protein
MAQVLGMFLLLQSCAIATRSPTPRPSRPLFGVVSQAEAAFVIRGGYVAYDNDDEYDPYDDDDYDDEEGEVVNDTEKIDHAILDLPPPDAHKQRPSSTPGHQRQRPIRKKKKSPHWTQKLATQSIQMTGKLAWNTLVKQPSKLAYNVIRPKHVDIRETDGLWRLEQQVTEPGDRIVASVATIELQSRPRLVVIRKQEEQGKDTMKIIKEPYTFTKQKLSGSFQTQFVAPAFLVGENQMRLYGYRGTWRRKLADKRVIKLVGKIYQVHRQRFGKQRGEYVFGQAVGTFVARRRIRARVDEDLEEDDDEDDDEDEYDAEEWEDIEEEWEQQDE